jgi:hypothetical protein
MVVLAMAIGGIQTGFGQMTDDSSLPPPSFKHVPIKPRVEFGVGTLMYRGDIGGDSKGYNLLTANPGFTLGASMDMTPWLELGLRSVFGRVTVNEINTERRFNFTSSVNTLGLSLSYNFDHLLPAKRPVDPWVSIGFESFEFLAKSDLRDANGRYYHYWTDGTIRDLPQDAPNASEAVLLERDYIYETDLRELNADGQGKYPDRSWAVPVGAGVTMKVNDRFRVRMGATYHFTFTDLIDNISPSGEGARTGNGRMDRFMYSFVALNYDLNITPKNQPIRIEFMDDSGEMMVAWLEEDSDGDGVNDFIDLSAGTPRGAKVDKFGRPIDTDGDGIPDFRDLEIFSPDPMAVNNDGETMSDDWWQLRHGAYIDSLRWSSYWGFSHFVWDSVRINGPRDLNPKFKYFDVYLGSDEEGLTQEKINQLLSVVDIKTEKINDVNHFAAGEFPTIEQAVDRKLELQEKGIEGQVSMKAPEGRVDVSSTASAIEDQRLAERQGALPGESPSGQSQAGSGISGTQSSGQGDSSVSQTATSNQQTDGSQSGQSSNQSSSVNGQSGTSGQQPGSGQPTQSGSPSASSQQSTSEGHGQQPGISTGAQGSASGSISPQETVTTLYRVQLGAFRKPLSEDVFNNIPDVIAIKGADGLTRYSTGSFTSMEAAARHKVNMQLLGFKDAFVTAYKSGDRVTLAEAGATVVDPKADVTFDSETTGVDPTSVKFTILLGVFEKQVPTEVLDAFLELGGVKAVRNRAKGTTSYIKGEFASKQEAEAALKSLEANPNIKPNLAGKFNDQVIDAAEAERLKGGN